MMWELDFNVRVIYSFIGILTHISNWIIPKNNLKKSKVNIE